jgi:hydrogenase maturation protease
VTAAPLPEAPPRVLVAGVGNVFLGDDGFGVEVAHRLSQIEMPAGVTVRDYGIRGVHLAYELLDGYDVAILVDAVPRGGQPGTVYVIEPEADDNAEDDGAPGVLVDAHGMDPTTVIALLHKLGGRVGRLLVVGCEPADVAERMGLSPPVAGAVDEAIEVVRELVAEGTMPRRGASKGKE